MEFAAKNKYLQTMKKMAKIVDKQNIRDPALKGYASISNQMSDDYDNIYCF